MVKISSGFLFLCFWGCVHFPSCRQRAVSRGFSPILLVARSRVSRFRKDDRDRSVLSKWKLFVKILEETRRLVANVWEQIPPSFRNRYRWVSQNSHRGLHWNIRNHPGSKHQSVLLQEMELESKCLPNILCYKAVERQEQNPNSGFHSSKPKFFQMGLLSILSFRPHAYTVYIHIHIYIEREGEIHIHFLSMWVYILCFLHSISSSLSLFWDIPNFLPTSRSEETPRRDPEIRGRLGPSPLCRLSHRRGVQASLWNRAGRMSSCTPGDVATVEQWHQALEAC